MFYGNVEDFKKYLLERNIKVDTAWTDVAISSTLLVVSEWLDNVYENIWIGYKTDGYDQERSWPRTNAITVTYPSHIFDKTVIPEEVNKAVYELAYRQLQNPQFLVGEYSPNKYRSVTIHGAVSVEYSQGSGSVWDVQSTVPVVQSLMSFLIDPNKSGNDSFSGRVDRV